MLAQTEGRKKTHQKYCKSDAHGIALERILDFQRAKTDLVGKSSPFAIEK